MDYFWSIIGLISQEGGFKMAELRLQISDDLVEKLKRQLGDVKITDIARDALTLYNWAVDERADGNIILASDKSGEKMTRLAMPSIEKAAPMEKTSSSSSSSSK
jgi:hypothetical protein